MFLRSALPFFSLICNSQSPPANCTLASATGSEERSGSQAVAKKTEKKQKKKGKKVKVKRQPSPPQKPEPHVSSTMLYATYGTDNNNSHRKQIAVSARDQW